MLLSGQAGQPEGKLGRLGLPPRTLSCDWRAPTGLKKDLEAPILSEIYAVLYQGKSAHRALMDLMTRSLKEEI